MKADVGWLANATKANRAFLLTFIFYERDMATNKGWTVCLSRFNLSNPRQEKIKTQFKLKIWIHHQSFDRLHGWCLQLAADVKKRIAYHFDSSDLLRGSLTSAKQMFVAATVIFYCIYSFEDVESTHSPHDERATQPFFLSRGNTSPEPKAAKTSSRLRIAFHFSF